MSTVNLTVPFEAIVDSIAQLPLTEKRILWEILEEELALAEEALWEEDPDFQAQLQEARAAYKAGDYISLDAYIEQQSETRE
jgi:hypothetical protein